MDAEHRRLLADRFDIKRWFGRSELGDRTIRGFALLGAEIEGWSLLRTDVRDHAEFHSMWGKADTLEALLSVDVSEYASVKDTHERLLEILGDMQSDAIELRLGDSPGDVAFGFSDTMLLFARANIVVLTRNAGREIVTVYPVARALDGRVFALAADRPGPEPMR